MGVEGGIMFLLGNLVGAVAHFQAFVVGSLGVLAWRFRSMG
jgi:hypothetical protein